MSFKICTRKLIKSNGVSRSRKLPAAFCNCNQFELKAQPHPRSYPVRLGRVASELPWTVERSILVDRWIAYLEAEGVKS